ncbi:FAD-dependent oxidoreductase [Cupriavidus basilensis]
MSGAAGLQAGRYDVAVLGAGAAGMMCAAVAGQGGARVVLIDHATRLAEKIRISGGGRCNFTNLQAGPANYLSANPHFCRSALARYTPQHFLELMRRHGIDWHEKHRGQLFCNDSAEDVIAMLRAEVRCRPCALADRLQHRRDPARGRRLLAAHFAGPRARRGDCGGHGRALDPEDRRDRLWLPHCAPVRPEDHRNPARLGAADLRRPGLAAVRAAGRGFAGSGYLDRKR